MKTSLEGALISLFAFACGTGSSDPAPTAPSLDVAGDHRVVESVSGSGSFIVSTQEGDWRTFGFTARRYADGTVEGEWERVRRLDGDAAGTSAHGFVTCFTVIGNEAWVGGIATGGIYAEPPNNGIAFRVQDNGEGANAAGRDRMSLEYVQLLPSQPLSYCQFHPDRPGFFDLEAGNVQIR